MRLIDVDVLHDELKMHVDQEDGHVLKEEYETVMFFVDCYSETVDPTPKWIPDNGTTAGMAGLRNCPLRKRKCAHFDDEQ